MISFSPISQKIPKSSGLGFVKQYPVRIRKVSTSENDEEMVDIRHVIEKESFCEEQEGIDKIQYAHKKGVIHCVICGERNKSILCGFCFHDRCEACSTNNFCPYAKQRMRCEEILSADEQSVDWDYTVNNINKYMQRKSFKTLRIAKVKELLTEWGVYDEKLFKRINGIPVIVHEWIEHGHAAFIFKWYGRKHLFLAYEKMELSVELSQRVAWVVTNGFSRANVTYSGGSEFDCVTKEDPKDNGYDKIYISCS